MSIFNQDKIVKAWYFASNAHKEQKIKSLDLPYLTHIGNVSLELMAVCNSIKNLEFALTCAILHDTIEDTDTTYDDIKNSFGKAVADGVLALSKNKTLDEDLQMIDSINRIKKEPKEVWMVKLADRISNLKKPPSTWDNDKVKNYYESSKLILQELGSSNKELAKRLEEKINAYESYIK